jgi:hypothetical protein
MAIVNEEPTPYDDEASVVVRGRAGDVLADVAQILGALPNLADAAT